MKSLLLYLLPVFFLVGCGEEPIPEPTPVAVEVIAEPAVVLAKFPLSMEMINGYSLSSQDICDLQLYISNDIELQRKIPASSSSIDNGVLVVNKEDNIHRIFIKKDTPCVAIEAEDNYIVVKFNESLELTFMYNRGKKDLFLLTANKWIDGEGSLEINGKEYQAIGKSGQTYLMLNKTDMDNSNNNEMIIKGSLVNPN